MVGSKMANLGNHGLMVVAQPRRTFGGRKISGILRGRMVDLCKSSLSRCGSKAGTMVVKHNWVVAWLGILLVISI